MSSLDFEKRCAIMVSR